MIYEAADVTSVRWVARWRGWASASAMHYDDPSKPSKIVLCPSLCGTANASVGTKIEALVGCTAPAPR